MKEKIREISSVDKFIDLYLQYVKPLEQVKRWGTPSLAKETAQNLEQSVAEHVAGMLYLADAIFKHDTALDSDLNKDEVRYLIQIHDWHEGTLDDVIYKTTDRKLNEETADKEIARILDNRPGGNTGRLLDEYRQQKSKVALFVKGIDRLEAQLTMFYSDRTDKYRNRKNDTSEVAAKVAAISPFLQQLIIRLDNELEKRNQEIGQGELNF